MINDNNKSALRRQARFGAKAKQSVATTIRQSNFQKSDENRNLLLAAAGDWDNLRNLRLDRARNLRYKNGDQWGDIVQDPTTGKFMREEQVLSNGGKVPLKHNFIQQFVRNIVGQYLSNKTQSIIYARTQDDSPLSDMLTNTLQACQQLNEVSTIDTAVLEDLLLGGLACTKIRYAFWSTKNRADGRVDLVNINRLFFNTDTEDPRMFDLRRIGEIHDFTIDELVRNFAHSVSDAETLRKIYSTPLSDADILSGQDKTKESSIESFLIPKSPDKCRVIEVWVKSGRWVTYVHDYADGTEQITLKTIAQIEAINKKRIEQAQMLGIDPYSVSLMYAKQQYEYYWQVKFLTPYGECVSEFETPYTHQEHPYTIANMPMMDGAIRGVMSDLIDIQRYINRLIVMIDFIMGSSAKGVLMIPEDCIPDGMDKQDFTDEWVKANGVIVYKARADGAAPTQISANSTNIGAFDMLSIEMNMIQQIAGLSGAIQGQQARANTPSSLYAQEAQNSAINYKVVFERFGCYVAKRDEKLLKVLMQYYTDRRHVDISGKSFTEQAKFYDPQMALKIVDFNLVVSQSTDTPVYRQVTEDMLMEFLKAGFITLDIFLDNSSLPQATKLKADLKRVQEQVATGDAAYAAAQVGQVMANNGITEQQTNPQALALMQRFAGQ